MPSVVIRGNTKAFGRVGFAHDEASLPLSYVTGIWNKSKPYFNSIAPSDITMSFSSEYSPSYSGTVAGTIAGTINFALHRVDVYADNVLQGSSAIGVDGTWGVTATVGIKTAKLILISTGDVIAECFVTKGVSRAYTMLASDPNYATEKATVTSYSQALTVIAAVIMRDYTEATRRVDGLMYLINQTNSPPSEVTILNPAPEAILLADGTPMILADGTPLMGEDTVDTNTYSTRDLAICAYAIAFYLRHVIPNSKFPTYRTVLASLLNKLATFQVVSPGLQQGALRDGVGTDVDPTYVLPWASTTNNIVSYFAFKLGGEVLAAPAMTTISTTIRDALLTNFWNPTFGRFNFQVLDGTTVDPTNKLDTATWGGIFLMSLGDTTKAAQVYTNLTDLLSNTATSGYRASGTGTAVSVEGSLAAVAFLNAYGEKAAALTLLNAIAAMSGNGGLPEADQNEAPNNLHVWASQACNSWFIIASRPSWFWGLTKALAA